MIFEKPRRTWPVVRVYGERYYVDLRHGRLRCAADPKRYISFEPPDPYAD